MRDITAKISRLGFQFESSVFYGVADTDNTVEYPIVYDRGMLNASFCHRFHNIGDEFLG